MPPARSASAASRARRATSATRRTPPPRPRRLAAPWSGSRIRWDRLGRVGLLIVLAIVGGIYVQRTLSYLSTRAQADQQQAIVQQLTRANAQLEREQQALRSPATIMRDARALGMVKAGERPYVVTGLPSH